MLQKSDLKTISIAISFATKQMSFRRSGIQWRPIWPIKLPLVTALLGLPHHGLQNVLRRLKTTEADDVRLRLS